MSQIDIVSYSLKKKIRRVILNFTSEFLYFYTIRYNK